MGLGSNVVAPFLVEWFIDIYLNTYGVDTTYTDIFLRFNAYLKKLVNSLSFDVFSQIVIIIGVVLLLYHFFSDLTEKAAEKQLSILIMGKSFCILFVSLFVIFHTKEIFIFLLKLIESIDVTTKGMSGSKIISKFLGQEVIQQLLANCVADHFSIWAILGYTLAALLIMLVNLGTRVYLMYYSATRVLQLFVYYIFAPIGMSDIFENDMGATINMNSAGFKYAKTMIALMLQVVVVSVIIQTYPLIAANVNKVYFNDEISDTESGDVNSNEGPNLTLWKTSSYPLRKFEFTDHKASVAELAINGANNIANSVKTIYDLASDGSLDSTESDLEESKEMLKNNEIYPISEIVNPYTGAIQDRGTLHDIDGNTVKKKGSTVDMSDVIQSLEKGEGKYRMTVDSTEFFFNWCLGSDGGKIRLFIILLATKILLVASSSRLCNVIVGTSV